MSHLMGLNQQVFCHQCVLACHALHGMAHLHRW